MAAPVDLKAARDRRAQRRHADAVLHAFDGLKHEDKRRREEQRAETERKARNQF